MIPEAQKASGACVFLFPNRLFSLGLSLVLLSGVLLSFSPPVFGQVPTLVDASFDPGTGANDDVFALALQPDGKILMAGQFTQINGTNRLRVARLNSDGSLDLSFNTADGPNDTVYALAVQPDGKILIGGAFTNIGAADIKYLARVNNDGSPDPSFTGGTNLNDELRALALQPDGKILIGGRFTSVGGQGRVRVARLLADGALDESFHPGAGANNAVRTLALQADGKILVGGQFTSFDGITANYLARLGTSGGLDFNCCDSPDAVVRSVAVQPDGGILLGGEFTTIGGVPHRLLARLLTNGVLDTNFFPGPVTGSVVRVIAPHPGGKILVGGRFTSIGGAPRARLARLQGDGLVDASFDPGAGANDEVFAVAVQTNGPVLAGGQFTTFDNRARNHIVRLLEEMPPPTLQFSQSSYSNLEYVGNLYLTVNRLGDTNASLSVRVHTENGTATAGLDYTAQDLVLNFPAGSSSQNFLLQFANDELVEPDETLQLVLSDPVGATLGTDQNVTFTILDTTCYVEVDEPVVVVQEDAVWVYVRARRTGSLNGSSAITFTGLSETALAGMDYWLGTNTAYFGGGSDTTLMGIPMINDGLVEGNEQFTFQLVGGERLGASRTAQITILDNDQGLSFTASNFMAYVPAGVAALTVARGSDGPDTLSVHFATEEGTARAGLDFMAQAGELVFAPGHRQQVIRVPLLRPCDGATNRVFTMRLSHPGAGASLGGLSVASVTVQPAAQPGARDSSFISPPGNFSLPMSVQDDGKILVLASSGMTDGGLPFLTGPDMIWRLEPNGSPDPAFQMAPIEELSHRIRILRSLGVQRDGKVFFTGLSYFAEGAYLYALSRVNADGSPDMNYQTRYAAAWWDPETEVLLPLPDGKLLVGASGRGLYDGSELVTNGIMRVLSDGGADPAFDAGSGIEPVRSGRVRTLALQPDGRILVGGDFIGFSGSERTGLARLHTDGSLDTSFNLNLDEESVVNAVVIAPDGTGDFFIAGRFDHVGGVVRTNLARLHADGALDLSFDPGGLLAPHRVTALLAQPYGKIIVGGVDARGTVPDNFGVARLNADGTPDAGFQTLPCFSVTQLGAQPDGGIIVAGYDLCEYSQRALIRLHGEGLVKFTSIERMAAGQVRLGLDSPTARAVEVQSSNNFLSWTTLARLQLMGCPVTFIDTNVSPASHRFYRALPQETGATPP